MFLDVTFDSLEQVFFTLDTPFWGIPLFVNLDVVMENVPAIIGIYVLDNESLTPYTVTNRLSKHFSVNFTDRDIISIYLYHMPIMGSPSSHSFVPFIFSAISSFPEPNF